jgi:Domain of unknown function (DUF4214)
MLSTHAQRTLNNSPLGKVRRLWKPAALCALLLIAIAGYLAGNYARSAKAKTTKSAPVESFDVGMKMGKFNVQLGRDTATSYRGSTASAEVLSRGLARPLSMTSDDFDDDGMTDLAIGYSSGAGGVLSIRHGNIEAIAPRTPEVSEGLRAGHYPSPFLNEVDTYRLPENPDFVAAGDFNADGFPDVIAAARGGENLYLLAGNGQGGFAEPRRLALPGQVTAMIKGQFNEGNGSTTLAVGIVAPGGPRVLVYDEDGKGVLGQPDSFQSAGEVTALTIAKLDDDTAGDLAVGSDNHLTVIHGRNPADSANSQNRIEQFEFPFNVRAIAAGDFVFDREGKNKLALLSDDGTVHLMMPGPLDTRPFSYAELEAKHQLKIKVRRGQEPETAMLALDHSMVHRTGKGSAWMEAESQPGAAPVGTAPQALMTATRVSGLPLDDLMLLDGVGNKVQVLQNTNDGKRMHAMGSESMPATDAVNLSSAPVAALTARLSMDGRPSTVILQEGNPEPMVILAVAATFNVTSNADLVDTTPGNGVCLASNGQCTLRAALMECSYFGGSNTVNLLAGTTYTLTKGSVNGGPDDEFDAAGDDQTGGDLDIIDLNRICSQLGGGNPAAGCPGITLGGTPLTSVTIAGGNTNTTIIAMGALTPAATGNNAGLNHDRILDVNNFADPQFDINVTISNLTMQSGNAPHFSVGAGNFYHTPGGAIQYDGINNVNGNPLGTLTLTGVKITSNIADGQGGGVFAIDDTMLVQTNSLVTLNSSTLGSGGGISYSGGNKVTTQTLTINSSSVVGGAGAANTAPDTTFGNGAGVSSVGGSGVTINGATISNNVAGNQGGGLAVVNSANIAITSSTISSNTAKTHGGGIFSSARNAVTNAASTMTLTSANVTGNTADSDANASGNGGGIYNLFGTLTVQTNSHVDGNAAVNGGGIFNTWTGNTNDASASLSVNVATIGQTGSGNTAKNNGGGVMISPGAPTTFGTYSISGATIQANTANSDSTGGGDGGGIYIDSGSLNTLNNSTIDTNVANLGTGDGIFMNGGSITAAGALSLSGDDSLNINAGTFTSTAGTFNLAGNFTRAVAGAFTHNSGTLNFNGGGAQSINGTATSETFNNFIVNKGGGALSGGGSTTALTIAGTTTLTAGTFSAGTITAITMSGGDWTNNGGVFTPGSSVVSFTNTGAGQNINGSAAAQTFNGITVAKTAQTLAVAGSTTSLTLNGSLLLTSGTFSAGTATAINVAGDWTNSGGTFTPGAGTVTFNGGGAQNLNGTAVTQTFNNFTVSKGGGTLTGGGGMTTLTVGGNFAITAGAFATGGTMTTLNVAGNWANGGTFTPGASNTVVFNGNNSTQTLTGTTSFTNLTSNHTGTGGVTASGSSLTVTGLMHVQSGTFTSSSTFNNVQIDSGTTLASDGNTMNVSGNWTNNGGTFTPSTGTVNFNGGAAQTLGGTAVTQTFNNFTVNKAGGTLTVGGSTTTLNVGGNVTLTLGTFAAGTATTMNVTGNWANNGGSFTAGAGTVTFNGGAGQTISGTAATVFNNLTNGDAGGISMTNDNTVAGVLALGSSDITVANTKTLSQTSATASTGTSDVIGSVKRTNTSTLATAYTFGNPNNRITTTAGTAPTDITVNLVKAAPAGFLTAVQRTYTITPTGGVGFTATLRLHYLDGDLNGNTEASLILRRFNGLGWAPYSATASDTTNNWVENNVVHNFSPWTFSSCCSPTATNGIVNGRIIDGNGMPVSGTVVNLSGTQARKTITDANGNYEFDDVDTTGFYTVTPSRANFNFNPSNRSFSQVGSKTEAAFTGMATGDSVNPLDTPEYFVRQQYVDVLNREPDEAGFNYWSDQILACGGDADCTRSRRISVAAAFFIEQEAQVTGSYIYNLYQGSLGRQPVYTEYSTDRGQVVGGANLETEKAAFALSFVQRAEFAGRYQANVTADSFVDALLGNVRQSTGVDLTSTRDNLIAHYNTGTSQAESRSFVLRDLTESAGVKSATYNSAFVLTEYFAYLKRDPDAGGYTFWLNVLNTADANNYRGMVCSFITSREYQQHFSQVVSRSNSECAGQ